MTKEEFKEKVKIYPGISGWIALFHEGSVAIVGAESEDAAVSLLWTRLLRATLPRG
jgi:hypothetical protein